MDAITTNPAGLLPAVMSEQTVADLLGISVKTLRNRRCAGDGPVPVRVSRQTVVYLPEDVTSYLRGLRVVAAVNPVVPTPVPPVPQKRGPGRPKGLTRNYRINRVAHAAL